MQKELNYYEFNNTRSYYIGNYTNVFKQFKQVLMWLIKLYSD